jgi:adenine phosphoribosyltransferase
MNTPSTVGNVPDELRVAVERALRTVPDFPRPGVLFRDITPLLAEPALFRRCVEAMAAPFAGAGVTHVAAVESRGFIFAAPVALALDAALVLVRKPGKLPHLTERYDYALEYGADALEVHRDACSGTARVLIVDDVLATGGTANAARELVSRLGATVIGCAFLLELERLGGRSALDGTSVESIVRL